ncbi:MerR family transcriptional regulator [Siminovitchia sp. 179-K 8D1 HS]|uniref:MerR family transcriptional regulator n=1 Tax=Siminovitchia sp. 179-K 8D1 HS TaxID=3142385 RepID=UPI0039A05AFB
MKVKEVSDLSGISIRTLHHYDEIGLLSPSQKTPAGYRLYSAADLETLQQILFFKELGFSLKTIKEIIQSPSFDRYEALQLQKKLLLEKRARLDKMIDLVEKTIKHEKGEIEMSNKEKFAGFDFSHNPYEQEARERWGDEAVDQSNARLARMSKEEQKQMGEQMNAIYRKLAHLKDNPPESEEAQAAIGEWFTFLNGTVGNYSLAAFKGLGEMYVADERFTKNIDQFGDGLAKFMRDAMAVYADQNQ